MTQGDSVAAGCKSDPRLLARQARAERGKKALNPDSLWGKKPPRLYLTRRPNRRKSSRLAKKGLNKALQVESAEEKEKKSLQKSRTKLNLHGDKNGIRNEEPVSLASRF